MVGLNSVNIIHLLVDMFNAKISSSSGHPVMVDLWPRGSVLLGAVVNVILAVVHVELVRLDGCAWACAVVLEGSSCRPVQQVLGAGAISKGVFQLVIMNLLIGVMGSRNIGRSVDLSAVCHRSIVGVIVQVGEIVRGIIVVEGCFQLRRARCPTQMLELEDYQLVFQLLVFSVNLIQLIL